MRRLWLLVVALLIAAIPGYAQNTQGNNQSNIGGLLIASNFAQWTVPQGNQGGYSWSSPDFCKVTFAGETFNAFSVGTPVQIVDTGNVANSETVTVNGFQSQNNGCSVNVSPARVHTSFFFKSATAGLGEALAFAGTQPYQIVLTPDWQRLGGTTGTITAAKGNSSVTISDQRTALIEPYIWNGSIYVQTPFGGGLSTTITGLAYSQDDTTIVASWSTNLQSGSALTCGGKAAVDQNVQQNVTFHQAVVTGLTPSTQYSCAVTSGSTTSSSTNVTTTAALTRTVPTTATNGAATIVGTGTNNYTGDTFYNAVSNDNNTYIVMDDSVGLGNSTAQNLQIGKLTSESTFSGSQVNALTNFGLSGTSSGTDGVSGHAASNKENGLFAMAGDLYIFASRNVYTGVSGLPNQTAWNGFWMKSHDHGATWNSFQNPPAVQANGISPNPLGSEMFATNLYGWCVPTRYALDDGTLGYTTVGNRVDGANAFVYISCTDGQWNNSSNLYLARIPRIQFAAQNYSALQYWVGATSTTTSFVNDSNWSSSPISATPIYTASNQTSSQDMVFVPGFNVYMLLEWYQPNPAVSSNTVWNIYTGTTPAGPWTLLLTQTNNPSGFYNPTVQHRTFATNTSTSNVALQLLFSGDYANQATYYHQSYSTLTLNPITTLLDVINAGTATYAGSASHLLRSAYSGAAIRIQRSSDSTQSDVGFNENGTINQSTITSFCSGTTCGVAKLYDQSGNGHDAVQATFANMPLVYTGGAVVTNGVNSQVAMKWDNTERYLASTITFSGNNFETVGTATLGTAGGSGYAGLVILTDGSHSGGSGTGLIAMLDEAGTNQQIADGTSVCTLVPTTVTYGTQFMFDDFNATLSAPGSCNSSINNTTINSQSTATPETIAATQLWIGSDYPATTYYWNGYASDVVVYSANLTSGQRSSAHTIEAAFFGTP